MFSSFQKDDVEEDCGALNTKLTSKPKICKDLKDTSYIPIFSTTGINDNQPLTFIYKGTPKVYTDLSDSQIYMLCKLVHKDGTELEDREEVAPINNIDRKSVV
jgi:hypothetical protein